MQVFVKELGYLLCILYVDKFGGGFEDNVLLVK
jgi:hypothetical protein